MPEFKGERFLPENLLEDIDQAVVDAFEKELRVQVRGRLIPVVYATQERYAQIQKTKGFRDDNGVLILPLISIRRTGIELIPEYYREPANGGGKITLLKRPATAKNTNIRLRYGNSFAAQKQERPLVFETISTRYPLFYRFKYEVMLWSSYISDMNVMQETLLEEYRGFYQAGGYRFYGQIDGSIDDVSNTSDFTANERLIKSRYNIMIETFLHRQSEMEVERSIQKVNFLSEVVTNIEDV